MVIKVHGIPQSPAVRRVLLCLAEKDLEHEFVFVDLSTAQQKEEPFISINPFGQVPGFQDGDMTLFESRAMTRYIAHAYANKGTPLIFEDPKKMAIVGVWLQVEALKFDAAAQKLSFEILIKPIKGLRTDAAAVARLQAELASVLDVYEARLAESKYLGGDQYSLADLHHIPIIANLMRTEVRAVFDARPRVAAWAAELQARPAWQKVLAGA